MQALCDYIGHNPEVGWEEYEAVDTLTAVLRDRGWQIVRRIGWCCSAR